MYISPGSVFDGLGFFAIASIIHRIPMGSAHISACPMKFSLPGTHTQWFEPGRNTVIFPVASISATVASLVMMSGPDKSARRILAFTISSDMLLSPVIAYPCTLRLSPRGHFGPTSSIVKSRLDGRKRYGRPEPREATELTAGVDVEIRWFARWRVLPPRHCSAPRCAGRTRDA